MACHEGKGNIPLGAQRTTLTACVCLDRVARYSTLRFSPSSSILHSCRNHDNQYGSKNLNARAGQGRLHYSNIVVSGGGS